MDGYAGNGLKARPAFRFESRRSRFNSASNTGSRTSYRRATEGCTCPICPNSNRPPRAIVADSTNNPVGSPRRTYPTPRNPITSINSSTTPFRSYRSHLASRSVPDQNPGSRLPVRAMASLQPSFTPPSTDRKTRPNSNNCTSPFRRDRLCLRVSSKPGNSDGRNTLMSLLSGFAKPTTSPLTPRAAPSVTKVCPCASDNPNPTNTRRTSIITSYTASNG